MPTFDVPIAETEAASLVTVAGDAPANADLSGVELRVRFSRRDAYGSAPMPTQTAVEDALAREPVVAHVNRDGDVDGDATFSIELPSTQRATVATLADLLNRLARHRALTTTFGIALASDDCAAALRRARRDSLAAALRAIVPAARSRHRRATHLVLAIAEPESAETGSVCRDDVMARGDTPLDAILRALWRPSSSCTHR